MPGLTPRDCAKPWPCPTVAVATGLDCASHDPISGAVCQKPAKATWADTAG